MWLIYICCSISSYFASSSTAFLRHWVEWVMTCDALHSTTFTTISTVKMPDCRWWYCSEQIHAVLLDHDGTRFWYLFGCRVVIFEEFARIWIYRIMYRINNHNRLICRWGDQWNTPTKQPMGRFILGCHGTCTTLLSFKGSPKMLRAELGGPKRWDISHGIQSVRCSLYGHVGVHQRTLFSGAGTISQYTIIMGPDHPRPIISFTIFSPIELANLKWGFLQSQLPHQSTDRPRSLWNWKSANLRDRVPYSQILILALERCNVRVRQRSSEMNLSNL